MRKRYIIILALGLAVAAWFHFFGHKEQPTMQVTASLRPPNVRLPRGAQQRGAAGNAGTRGARGAANRGRAPDGGTNLLVLFELLNPTKITSLKVIEVVTNQGKAPDHILWHLVSTNASDPVKTFFYGQVINGMTNYLPGVNSEALVPHVKYRLDMESGKFKGSTFFQTIPVSE